MAGPLCFPPASSATGALTFTASSQHASVTYYIANQYQAGTSVLVDSLNIGKPGKSRSDVCIVDIEDWSSSQRNGDYKVKVAAYDGTGSNESVSNAFSVPLQSE
jgi:hypothetical protein